MLCVELSPSDWIAISHMSGGEKEYWDLGQERTITFGLKHEKTLFVAKFGPPRPSHPPSFRRGGGGYKGGKP